MRVQLMLQMPPLFSAERDSDVLVTHPSSLTSCPMLRLHTQGVQLFSSQIFTGCFFLKRNCVQQTRRNRDCDLTDGVANPTAIGPVFRKETHCRMPQCLKTARVEYGKEENGGKKKKGKQKLMETNKKKDT
jgi:hypothetical protein